MNGYLEMVVDQSPERHENARNNPYNIE